MYKDISFDHIKRRWQNGEDSLEINKQEFVLKLIIGYQRKLLSRFSIDFYSGLGIRYQLWREEIFYKKRFPYGEPSNYSIIYDIHNQIERLYPTINLGFNVGFLF